MFLVSDETTGERDHPVAAQERARRFERLVRKMLARRGVTLQESLDHFAVQNEGERQGLAVGETAPDLTLNDHTGRPRRFGDMAATGALLLVFVRSAHW